MSTYKVHVHGPDDVLPATDEADAQRQVDEINSYGLEHVSAHVLIEDEFDCVNS
jgi:hypothetical protein